MSALAPLGALLAAAAMAGILGVIAGTRRQPPRPARPAGRAQRWYTALLRVAGGAGTARERRRRRVQLAVAAAASVAVYLLTAVPMLALIAAYAVLGAPVLLQSGSQAAARLAAQAALAQWTRALAVRIAVGTGLEQAVIATARDVPDAIDESVQMLAWRLESGWAAESALAAFAETMADPTADYIALALRRAAARRGGGLSAVLERLSAGVEARVRMGQAVDADRARIRTTVRLINMMVIGMVVALQFDRAFMAPYRSLLGQLVLFALAALYTAALAAMTRLTRGRAEPRLLGAGAASAPRFQVFGRSTP